MGWSDALPTRNYLPSSAIGTPTYEGSGQATEPCVKFIPAGWNGWRYWMGMNPLPAAQPTPEQYENPSILVSNNGETWQVPAGLTNPIKGTPTNGNNADAAIMLGQDNKLYLYWNQVDPVTSTNRGVWASSSTDGVTWSTPARILAAAFDGVDVMEPKVVWDGAQYRLYTADIRSTPTLLVYRTSSSPTGPWGSPVTVTINGLGDSNYVWHFDLEREASGRWIMALCDTQTARRSWLASSPDGVTFTCASRPLATATGWAGSQTYRPSVQPLGRGVYGLWIGGNSGTTWRVGFVTIPANEIP